MYADSPSLNAIVTRPNAWMECNENGSNRMYVSVSKLALDEYSR